MKKLYLFALMMFCMASLKAQMTRYVVEFKDKGSNTFTLANPSAYLSATALANRARYNIAIDSADLPVTQRYIDSIRLSGNVTILNKSKWLNSVSIKTIDAAAIAKISTFPFVKNFRAIAARQSTTDAPVNKKLFDGVFEEASITNTARLSANYYSYGVSNGQVKIHRTDFLHNLGFRGLGVRMAVLDAGFYHYLSLPTFDSMRAQNRVLDTWDFVAGNASVDEDDIHGMDCLSTIAANMPGVFVGTAPETSFFLFRTEDVSSEYPIEEHNLAAGLERADSAGVVMASISLGYNTFDNSVFDYTYADMNGDKTTSAIAADIAAKKGMLLSVAAGNEGARGWHYIVTPGDADSVMTVGAVDTNRVVGSFSSYGPSTDGRTKPNVAAVGWRAAVANPSTGLPNFANGTSFAAPNMAGVTACLWQAFPEENNMTILNELQKSADKFSTPNDRTGYGIPDVKKAFVSLLRKSFVLNAVKNSCDVNISVKIKANNLFNVVLERRPDNSSGFTTLQSFAGTSAFSLQNFQFTESLLPLSYSGNLIYRVRAEINGDTTVLMDSVVISNNTPCQPPVTTIQIGPNPVKDYLQVNIPAFTGTATLLVYNAAGQQVYKSLHTMPTGGTSFSLNIPTRKLSHGVYTLAIYFDNKKEKIIQFVK